MVKNYTSGGVSLPLFTLFSYLNLDLFINDVVKKTTVKKGNTDLVAFRTGMFSIKSTENKNVKSNLSLDLTS